MNSRILSASSLLSFEIEPDPNPLTVSTAAQPVTGRLNIQVGVGNSGPAFCKSIRVRIRIGAGASALTENRSQLTSAVTGATGWTARPGFAEGEWQVFEFAADRPVNVTGRAVTLVISQIAVNRTAGNADLQIIEESSPTNGSFTEKTTDAVVAKFPAEFVFRNFRPTKVMVGNGEKATLRWDGSAGAEYTMFWGRNRSEDVSGVREWDTPEGLAEATGFMLQAKVTAGGETLTHTLTTVVMVERPDLEVGDLNIGGKTTFRGGPLEGLVQNPVLIYQPTRKGTYVVDFRTQGPGIIYIRAHVNASAQQNIDLSAGDTGMAKNVARVMVTGPGTFGTASQPIASGRTLKLVTIWPETSGDGTVEYVWFPLGPQEPPVRLG
ncbi:hypothetical protein ABH926_008514 [Catenulispora sp. GP43]